MNILELLQKAVLTKASDLFIVAGLPISMRIHGAVTRCDETRLTPEDTRSLIEQIYHLADERNISSLQISGDDDFSFAIPGLSRFRVSAYKQRGSLSAVIRVISFELPNPSLLGIPERVMQFADLPKGLILVTGNAGSGKSTTLACMIDAINHRYPKHIITLEDPLEFLHRHDRSIVSQREIHVDTESYVTALRASLRQSPDVILLGEMRDHETMQVAMTAAETGHLILSTLHTPGVASTIDRIIDVFPPDQQHQIAVQLSMVLQAVISQQLIPSLDGGMVPAFEIMTVTPAIRNMIRDKKIPQLEGLIASSAGPDLLSMDADLLHLYQKQIISGEIALSYAANPEMLKNKL